MSPVLLDHRNLKWIWLSVGLLVAMTFFGGYIMGFEKSNNKWLARLDPVEITLPNALVSDLMAVEPQTPEIEEPGASIDVDSVDESAVEKVLAIMPDIEDKPVKLMLESNAEDASRQANTTEKLAAMSETESAPSDRVSGIGGPAQDEQDAELSSEPSIEATSIVDDASEETARYSIQVGMYRSFDNAASKVELLINLNLSAYLQEYKNKNDETRYNVRFGYFNAFSNAEQALKIYQQNYSGSGYIARFVRQ